MRLYRSNSFLVRLTSDQLNSRPASLLSRFVVGRGPSFPTAERCFNDAWSRYSCSGCCCCIQLLILDILLDLRCLCGAEHSKHTVTAASTPHFLQINSCCTAKLLCVGRCVNQSSYDVGGLALDRCITDIVAGGIAGPSRRLVRLLLCWALGPPLGRIAAFPVGAGTGLKRRLRQNRPNGPTRRWCCPLERR